ncbi:MAG: ParA family protein [Armatimonadetes bacterium]|nr:ParA family protein [Armatimonadota bacterium]MDW8122691.1 ParA family protein [Armatimonadota bacterium]
MRNGRTTIIATVNFKGGVGKTTITWLLARCAAKDQPVLVVDGDAQMSLTTAVELAEETGRWHSDEFEQWFHQHKEQKKSLFHALERFTDGSQHFDFPVNHYVAYKFNENLWFVPATPDLYWTTLEVFDRDRVRNFIPAFLRKLCHASFLPDFRYCLFDCPPSFSHLSFSILTNCDLILVPVNPDVFADRGLRILVEGLVLVLDPHPLPKVAVLMNRARPYRGTFTRETLEFWQLVEDECERLRAERSLCIRPLSTFIPDRVDIKRAIPRGGTLPEPYPRIFANLWGEIVSFAQER